MVFKNQVESFPNVFENLDMSNRSKLNLEEYFFCRTGLLLFSEYRIGIDRISRYLEICLANTLSQSQNLEFDSVDTKSQALLERINFYINENLKNNKREVALLWSGGKDSSLVAKILTSNGIKVNAYYISNISENLYKNSSLQNKLEQLAMKLNISNLNYVNGVADPEVTFHHYNYKLMGNKNGWAVANLFDKTTISNENSIWFAQGCDTLSNMVHTQRKFWNNENKTSEQYIDRIVLTIFLKSWSTKNRLIGLKIIKDILKHVPGFCINLSKLELQDISRFLGMYLVHSPGDSKFIYKICHEKKISVFNPFHDDEVFKIYSAKINPKLRNQEPDKLEINNLIEFYGLENLSFMTSTMNSTMNFTEKKLWTDKMYRKSIFDLYKKRLWQ